MPDGHAHSRRERLAELTAMAWPSNRHDEYVRGAIAWIEFSEGRAPDPLDLALHTTLLGFDDRYYSGLMRLFTLLRLGDR